MKALAATLAILLCGALAPRADAQTCDLHHFKVALAIGHTLSQPGGDERAGATKFGYNQRLARVVQVEMGRNAIATMLIGEAGTPLQLEARAASADLFLVLHHDSVQPQYLATWTVDGKPQRYSDAFHSYSVFVSDENAHAADSRRFGALIGETMLAAEFSPSTAPTVCTAAPSRRAATAWFAPLPPGCMEKPLASRVCPGAGSSSITKTKSRLIEPKTTMSHWGMGNLSVQFGRAHRGGQIDLVVGLVDCVQLAVLQIG